MNRGIGFSKLVEDWHFSGKNYLFTIGIDNYKYWNKLNNAVRDVKTISQVLINFYQFEGKDHFSLLDEQASEENIYNQLRDLKRLVTEEDNLIIFYSGHGAFDEELDEGYWVPVGARKGIVSDWVSNADIARYIQTIKCHHVLLVMDSCFSGTFVQQIRGERGEDQKSRRVLSSGRKELVDDGIKGGHSPFAKGIINCLISNKKKSINTTKFIEQIKDAVANNAQQIPDSGRIRNSDDQGGEFIFYKKLDEEEVWKHAENKGIIENYEDYLSYFPEGKFAELAQQKILGIKENNFWKKTILNATPDDFKEYINQYPSGKFIKEAWAKYNEEKKRIEQRQKNAMQLALQADKEERIRQQYKKSVF